MEEEETMGMVGMAVVVNMEMGISHLSRIFQPTVCNNPNNTLKMKSHPSAKGLFKKRFPHYQALVEIYWKDRANGGVTTNPGLVKEDCATNSVHDESFGIDESDAVEFTSVGTSSGVPQSSRLKRKRGSDAFVSSMESLALGMNKLVEATVPYLSTLTNVLSNQESDISSKFAAELQKIADLSTREKLFAANEIIGNPSMAHMFMATPEDKRKEFIDEVLKN